MFNFLSVLILFPLEIITHMLARMTEAMTRNFEPNSDAEQKTKGIKAIIGPLLDRLIKANSKVIDQIATGQAESCAVYYPTECNPSGTTTYEACVTNGRVGLITCSKELWICPAFFQEGATESDDIVSGAVALFLGIFFLVICLLGLVFILKKMLLGASTRMIHKATDVNGYISMLIGTGITVLVQSSSVTTSVLTPLVGIGLVTVEQVSLATVFLFNSSSQPIAYNQYRCVSLAKFQMYPFTLGANIGTTITGLLAAVVASTAAAMQVALAHFFFNIFGIIIWYPLPFMRRVPIHLARGLGKATRWWRGFPILYIAVCFFGIPLILLGISALFTSGSKGLVVLGAILCIVLGLGLVKFLYWWCRQDGRYKTEACFRKRQKRKDIYNEIVDEWEPLKDDVEALKDHTGYVAPDEEDEEQPLKEESLKEEPKLTGHTVEEEEMSGEEMEVDDHPRGSALSSSGLDRSLQA
jgi:sodium-dependent phosphate cotransporter